MVLVAALIAAIVYLARENREFRRRIDALVDAEREAYKESQKRDAEELKEHRRREQEARR